MKDIREEEKMSLHPLGKVKEVVESVGMEISYAYEDLVFLEHNAFLLQFGDHGRSLIFHTSVEADRQEAAPGCERLMAAAVAAGFSVVVGCLYKITQSDDETIALTFH